MKRRDKFEVFMARVLMLQDGWRVLQTKCHKGDVPNHARHRPLNAWKSLLFLGQSLLEPSLTFNLLSCFTSYLHTPPSTRTVLPRAEFGEF
jgi:hypothetical protein